MADLVERRGGFLRVRLGPCMEPEFAAGSEIDIVPGPPPHVGMVALIRSGSTCILHRILDIHGAWVIHAGDAVPTPGLARVDQIIGIPAIHAIEVGGPSMEPALKRGHWALVEAAPPRRGEVGLFWSDGGPLLHRVADRVGPWYVHSSDATGAAGFAAVSAGRVRSARRPASRQAHLLGLALRLWATLLHLGLPPFRPAFRVVKKVLLGLSNPSRIS